MEQRKQEAAYRKGQRLVVTAQLVWVVPGRIRAAQPLRGTLVAAGGTGGFL
ncbi:MAG: hypothetical protein IAE83_17090 [Anaerolinea sp.]|nr:hypothetical protein [Anaerolinea sp.]